MSQAYRAIILESGVVILCHELVFTLDLVWAYLRLQEDVRFKLLLSDYRNLGQRHFDIYRLRV